jgi:hypothetical protein
MASELPAGDFGFGAFVETVDAILAGRGTCGGVLRLGGDRPRPGKPTAVMTARPLDDPSRATPARPRSAPRATRCLDCGVAAPGRIDSRSAMLCHPPMGLTAIAP